MENQENSFFFSQHRTREVVFHRPGENPGNIDFNIDIYVKQNNFN